MTDDQHPLHVFAQPVDDFGIEKDEAFPVHDELKHAQIGDQIDFNGAQEVKGWDGKWPGKGWIVQAREFDTRRDEIAGHVIHGLSLTLVIRQR